MRPLIVVVMLGAVAFATGARADTAKPASRAQALESCRKGCLDTISRAAPATKDPIATCADRCQCIINEMFAPDGSNRRPPSELPQAAAICAAPLLPAERGISTAGQPLLPGKKCSKATPPNLRVDDAGREIQLVGGGFTARVPDGWTAVSERPELVVVSAAAAASGVRPVFEVFVTPVCKDYDAHVVFERIAARGLGDLLAPAATARQIKDGRWSAGLGGPVGRTLMLPNVTLRTDAGQRVVTLFSTEYGGTKTFDIHAAAVCPQKDANANANAQAGDAGACQTAYFAMLGAR